MSQILNTGRDANSYMQYIKGRTLVGSSISSQLPRESGPAPPQNFVILDQSHTTSARILFTFLQSIVTRGFNNPTRCALVQFTFYRYLFNISRIWSPLATLNDDGITISNTIQTLLTSLRSTPPTDQETAIKYAATYAMTALFSGPTPTMTANDFVLDTFTSAGFSEDFVDFVEAMWTACETRYSLEVPKAAPVVVDTPGMPAGPTPMPESAIPAEPNLWVPLDIPGKPSKQPYLGKNWGLQGEAFAIDRDEEGALLIPDYSAEVPLTWSQYEPEIDSLLRTYATLNDHKKSVAEFFAGSNATLLPPPGFWFIIAYMMTCRWPSSLITETEMYFALGAAVYDGGLAAWYMKTYFM
jgi:hypothetical protein